MSIFPKSTFGQTVLLIAGLLMINQIVTYYSVVTYFIAPNYKQISQLVATQVDQIFVQGLHHSDNPQNKDFTAKTGIRFHTEESAMHAGLRDATHYPFMSRNISKSLDGPTDVRLTGGANYLIWIRPPQDRSIWISIPMQGVDELDVSPLTIYLVVISVLSVLGGWLFVRRLNRPLRALQRAAKKVGKGQFPDPLPLEGSSEMVSVTNAFNKMSQGIHQLESDRALMTAGISHDLRTPLTRIRLASEMLPDDQDWVKDGIEHDIDDMNAIIDQFIDYARQDQQEATENVDLNTLIKELINGRILEPGHSIETALDPLPNAKLRVVGIKRVLDNLIENAFRYGSENIFISTRVDHKNKALVCNVRDYGKGIPEAQLPALFAPFTQGDKARGSVGSGLGLAITKRIVESHGGQMLFSNHSSGGLIAGFTLPYSD
ncbi:two-component system sensor histidine kinase EnvZ [Glaciecola sp. MH2013]|uniref:two-component system sensor histidine kinase EnvZ n=1 Tax=Glaciecola sp. MH2013 TaxID=2785524 RepID=UPI0018A070F7|nr:two-component system sensor histidine kinase EnvZ [Glaciecola sp. MH2013]MBF7074347.1 two-component system sensor histidine kinase EnvZ [Glaciecola sp. MH2013]